MFGAPVDFNEPECSTSSECDQSGYMTMCCAKVVMFDPKTDTKDGMFRCLNKGIVLADVDMNIGDFNLQMRCLESSAVKLVGGAVAAASVLATLF